MDSDFIGFIISITICIFLIVIWMLYIFIIWCINRNYNNSFLQNNLLNNNNDENIV